MKKTASADKLVLIPGVDGEPVIPVVMRRCVPGNKTMWIYVTPNGLDTMQQRELSSKSFIFAIPIPLTFNYLTEKTQTVFRRHSRSTHCFLVSFQKGGFCKWILPAIVMEWLMTVGKAMRLHQLCR